MSKQFDFKTQLAVGKAGEARFLAHYSDLKQLDGRHGDFIGKTGRIIELKSESRTTKETDNFFLELECHYPDRTGNNASVVKPGGPWQAALNDVYYMVYMFADGIVYWMEVGALIEHLEKNASLYQKRTVRNKNFNGIGYLVPRASIEHLIMLKEKIA